MTDEKLKRYIEYRAKAGLPEVSEAEAKKESDALDSFGNFAFKKYMEQCK